jgi:hypothetical protein
VEAHTQVGEGHVCVVGMIVDARCARVVEKERRDRKHGVDARTRRAKGSDIMVYRSAKRTQMGSLDL